MANAFAQGCERVFLVDNDSRDDTVAEAVAAGAVLAETFATEQYDEVLRLEIMNRVVRTGVGGRRQPSTSGGSGSTPTSSRTDHAA